MKIGNNNGLFIALTYVCTAHCEKCITRYHKYLNKSMELSVMGEVIDFIKRIGFKGVINLGSGEPLTYTHLREFLARIFSLNDEIRIRLLSNGKIFTPALYSQLNSERITFGITFDGFYDTDLNGLQYNLDIETVKKQLADVFKLADNKNIYVNYTLNKKNKHSVFDFIHYAHDIGVKEIYITELKKFKGVKSIISNVTLSDEELEVILPDIEKEILKAGFEVYGLPRTGKNQNGCYYCWNRAQANPIIDIDGSVTFCCGHENGFIGYVTDEDIENKWAIKLNELVSDHNYAKKWCDVCFSRRINGEYIPAADLYNFT